MKPPALIIFCLLLVCPGSALAASAEEAADCDLGKIVVTTGRLPAALNETDRSITVIGPGEIASSPARSVPELLSYALGVDVRQRGPGGVQADVGIRGGTFEETLVLIDGVKVSDPQTGHHNLDLPLTLDDIERVEILRGAGSNLYGPNAFAGAINIITKKEAGKRGTVKGTVGDFRYLEGYGSLSCPVGLSENRLSFSRKKSTGYRENTDFDIYSLLYRSSLPLGPVEVDLTSGYTDKDFGANNFYYTNPDQREHTKTGFINAQADWGNDRLSLSPIVYWRYHKDDYSALEDRIYRNLHTTHSYGAELQSTLASKLGLTAFGGEFGNEEMESTNLGDHSRARGGFFLEHRLEAVERLSIEVGGSAYRYPDWGWEFWPGLDLGCRLGGGLRCYGSVGRSFRVPTFTELYYQGPGNKGNPDLKPEKAWTYEGGLKWDEERFRGSLAVFRRDGTDMIDWVRENSSDPWQARNIARIETTGVEVNFGLSPAGFIGGSPVTRFDVGYAFLDSSKGIKNLQSKYVLDHLKQQLVLSLENFLVFQLRQNWKLRYGKRRDGEEYFVVDTRIKRSFKNVELFVELTNLFDEDYMEVGDIPMPGRWAFAGLKIEVP